MGLKTLFLAYLFHILHYTHGYSLVTSRPVEEPDLRLMELEDIYNRFDDFRFHDREVGLTALKDKKLVSCFVHDYDPLWLPAPSEKNYIIHNQPCEKVNKTTDFQTLKKKAGRKIANMCKELYVFWLAARSFRPALLADIYQQPPSSRCVFDDDFPIPPATEELGGENTQSGNNGAHSFDFKPLVIHEIAPPMLRPDAPPMFREGAPQTLQNGPTRDLDAPPMSKTTSATQKNPPSLNAVLEKLLTKNGESLTVAPPTPDMKTPPPPKEFLRNNSK